MRAVVETVRFTRTFPGRADQVSQARHEIAHHLTTVVVADDRRREHPRVSLQHHPHGVALDPRIVCLLVFVSCGRAVAWVREPGMGLSAFPCMYARRTC